MKEMIERYIYDVTRRLPEMDRGEVKRELEASITDMLPDNPSEQDIVDVLTKLGAPRILAEQYRQKPRYLISPAVYDSYISVLKTVALIVGLVCAFVGAFSGILSASGLESIGELFGRTTGFAVEGALQAVFWVTLAFVIADRCGTHKKHTWTVRDLPSVPNQNGVRISRSGTIVGMALTVFFTGIIIMMIVRDEWFFVLVRGTEVINPFTQSALHRSIPYIILLGILALAVRGLKLYWGRWNVPVCVINAAHNLIWVSVVIYMLHWPDMFSGEFLSFAERTFTADANILKYISSGGVTNVLSALLILVAVVDTGVVGWNTWKGMRGIGIVSFS